MIPPQQLGGIMRNIELTRIDEKNFIQAFNLTLSKEQEQFVSDPIRSLAQAYVYYNQCIPFGIFHDNTMVGYMMVIYDYELAEYNIWHMMIDTAYQRQGFGELALLNCLDYIKSKPFGPSNKVVLTCNKDNAIALRLYHKLGFKETGNEDEDEIELALLL